MFTKGLAPENTEHHRNRDQVFFSGEEDIADYEADLILRLKKNVDTLQELTGKLSFSMKEISQILKIDRSSS